MVSFLAELEVNTTPTELGIKEKQISNLVQEVHGDINNDSIGKVAGVIEKIYSESL